MDGGGSVIVMHLSEVIASLAAAATLRPPYQPPTPAPAAIPEASSPYYAAQPYDAKWWQQFEDPVLTNLESAALASNHDVLIAIAHVQEARAVFDDTSLDRYPHVRANASLDRREQEIPGFVETPIATSTYRAGFDAFWELDVFGRVRAATRGAAATAESFDASLDDVRVIVAAEVARNYFELRGLQQQLAVAQRSLENQNETLRLTKLRRDAGVGEEQDVASASARVAGTEALLPPIRPAIAVRRNHLAVLTGIRPGELTVDLALRPYPTLAKALPLGDPSTLLRRRPDIRAAERRLAAAPAREAVAYAEEQQTLVKLNEQARESARAASIARARYRAGVADFLTLLDAERTQLQAEDAVAQGESRLFTGVVAVYKSLGGISE